MPAYPGSSLAHLLYENKQAFFWLNEAVGTGSYSRAFQLRRERGNFYPFAFSVEFAFSASPGVFQVDIQCADTDTDSHYVTMGTLNGGLNSSNVTRYEMTNIWAKYVRLNVVAAANAVNLTAMVTR